MSLRQEIEDKNLMQMAYSLAERARGWVSPNPYVGAVVARDNRIIGYGYHEEPGKPHAEVVALEKAGPAAKGSTLYVTLEPCVHWGRTPPCVEAIIRFGPRRLVVSALDPNPVVFQKGVQKLREAGLKVDVGCLEEKNQRLNEAYIKYITKKIPFIILKAGLSLDGKIAAADGSSRWVTGCLARQYGHLLRGEVDAILVGINTVIKDNPRLTIRHPLWKKKRLTRIILDSRLRFPDDCRLLATISSGPIIIFTTEKSAKEKRMTLEAKGVEIITVKSDNNRVDLEAVLRELGRREVASLLVEGGGEVLTSFLEARVADKVFLHVAPAFIGGKMAPHLFSGRGFAPVQASLKLRRWHLFRLGQDFILEGYF
ncbi:MAG: bifunctional diaminohydroxyphosphoribosylaminopyrimidine deaminase/5-amino-6-(5-phosphoribosylamino)uracil reductase RibD [Candidatus Aminicenantales bacterium]